jgi:hypothetical protein
MNYQWASAGGTLFVGMMAASSGADNAQARRAGSSAMPPLERSRQSGARKAQLSQPFSEAAESGVERGIAPVIGLRAQPGPQPIFDIQTRASFPSHRKNIRCRFDRANRCRYSKFNRKETLTGTTPLYANLPDPVSAAVITVLEQAVLAVTRAIMQISLKAVLLISALPALARAAKGCCDAG